MVLGPVRYSVIVTSKKKSPYAGLVVCVNWRFFLWLGEVGFVIVPFVLPAVVFLAAFAGSAAHDVDALFLRGLSLRKSMCRTLFPFFSR